MSTRSMILSLIWLDDEKILVCESLGLMKLIDAIAGDILSEFILPPSDERRCANAAIIRDKLLICGDRHGTVSVFKLHSTHRAKAAQVFHKIHSRLGVQSLFYNTRDDTIFSTGRDGTLRFYEIRNDDGKNAICRPLHSKKMPMSWVARIFETRAGDIYVLGFKHVICFIGLISLPPPPLSFSTGTKPFVTGPFRRLQHECRSYRLAISLRWWSQILGLHDHRGKNKICLYKQEADP